MFLPSQFQIASGNTVNLLLTSLLSTHSVTTQEHEATERKKVSVGAGAAPRMLMMRATIISNSTSFWWTKWTFTGTDRYIAALIAFITHDLSKCVTHSYERMVFKTPEVSLLFQMHLQNSGLCFLSWRHLQFAAAGNANVVFPEPAKLNSQP